MVRFLAGPLFFSRYEKNKIACEKKKGGRPLFHIKLTCHFIFGCRWRRTEFPARVSTLSTRVAQL